MNTKVILGILAVAVIGGGAYYFTTHKSASTSKQEGASSEAMTNDSNQSAGTFNGSIADLSNRGGSWQCTVDTSTQQAISSGTIYVSGKSVRADFSINVQGYGKVSGSMIADGEYTYSWSSMMPQGVKAKMTGSGQGGTQTSGQGVDPNAKYAYNCEPWTPDASKFVVPTSVTFRTI